MTGKRRRTGRGVEFGILMRIPLHDETHRSAAALPENGKRLASPDKAWKTIPTMPQTLCETAPNGQRKHQAQ
jgi:hypothetical protein